MSNSGTNDFKASAFRLADLLDGILQSSASHDAQSECPYCMNELLDRKDVQFVQSVLQLRKAELHKAISARNASGKTG